MQGEWLFRGVNNDVLGLHIIDKDIYSDSFLSRIQADLNGRSYKGSLRKQSETADQFRILGSCPPTLPLTQIFAPSET